MLLKLGSTDLLPGIPPWRCASCKKSRKKQGCVACEADIFRLHEAAPSQMRGGQFAEARLTLEVMRPQRRARPDGRRIRTLLAEALVKTGDKPALLRSVAVQPRDGTTSARCCLARCSKKTALAAGIRCFLSQLWRDYPQAVFLARCHTVADCGPTGPKIRAR